MGLLPLTLSHLRLTSTIMAMKMREQVVPAGGEIAAFSTIWFDDVTRSAVCVLVGTVPEHQRRGLGKAVVTEGLRRLRSMGATRAFANGHDPPADSLYGSVLGTKAVSEVWIREF